MVNGRYQMRRLDPRSTITYKTQALLKNLFSKYEIVAAYLGLGTVICFLNWETTGWTKWLVPGSKRSSTEVTQNRPTFKHFTHTFPWNATCTCKCPIPYQWVHSVCTLGSMGMVMVFSQGLDTTNSPPSSSLKAGLWFWTSSSGSTMARGRVHPPHQYSVPSELHTWDMELHWGLPPL